jgi:transposase-like protein
MNTEDLFISFQNEQSAYRFVEGHRWPNGPVCPHCAGARRIGSLRGASTHLGTYKCYHCRRLFTVRCGTMFASSHVPLHKWLQALYLCGCGTEDIKPYQLGIILNVTFKTAAFMINRIKTASATCEMASLVDENSMWSDCDGGSDQNALVTTAQAPDLMSLEKRSTTH